MTDSISRAVFFSDLLPKKCPILYKNLVDELGKENISYGLLKNTKDIWCRDYMPIQTDSNRFVLYKYQPDYLQTPYYRRTITDVKAIESIENILNGQVVELDLVLDGGNVVICGNKVVMTEKVYYENKDKSRNHIRNLLEEAFQRDILFIPWDREEILGHSDGVIHYIDDNRIFITNYYDYDAEYYNQFKRILDQHFEVIALSYNVKRKHQRSWAYINFLTIGNVLFVPQLGIPEDKQALQQISNILPNSKVIGIPALEAVRRGGALNCISWDMN
ncbi:MAG: agmatine deiminase family protein [Bacteroidales bacterium]|nr:agmatine deiminase family protein [Bacteroidales bacterium]